MLLSTVAPVSIATLVSFDDTNGAKPGPLVEDAGGNLFGVTSTDSTHNSGELFEVPAGTSSLNVLAYFGGAVGTGPNSLVIDSAGNLYGTTTGGGADGLGTVFELQRGAAAIAPLASLPQSMAGISQSSVDAVDEAGDLFGIAGDGYLFKLPHGTAAFTPFVPTLGAVRQLSMGPDGALYGETASDGAPTTGVVFEIPPGSSSPVILAHYGPPYATSFVEGISVDSRGDVFAATIPGDGESSGAIIEIPKGSSAVTTLASFAGNTEPTSAPVTDTEGDLFGVTGGGSDTAYELPAGGNAIVDLGDLSSDALPAAVIPPAVEGSQGLVIVLPSAGQGEILDVRANTSLPVNVTGDYTGTAAVVFSPRASHSAATDTINLDITYENTSGQLAGTISDSFGKAASVSGRVSGYRATLHVVTDPTGSDESGTLTLKVASDVSALTGAFSETNLAAHHNVSRRGRFTTAAPQYGTAVNIQPAPAGNIVGTYEAATAVSFFSTSPYTGEASPSGPPVYDSVSLKITSQSVSGAVGGTLSDDFDTLQISGTLSGRTLTFSNTSYVPPIAAGTFQIPARTPVGSSMASLIGSLSVTDYPPSPLPTLQRDGTFTLWRVRPAKRVVAPRIAGTYTGSAEEVNQNGDDGDASLSGPNLQTVTLAITSQSAGGAVSGHLVVNNGGTYDGNVTVTGTLAGDELSLQASGSQDPDWPWGDSISAMVSSDGGQIVGKLDYHEGNGLPYYTNGAGSLILNRSGM